MVDKQYLTTHTQITSVIVAVLVELFNKTIVPLNGISHYYRCLLPQPWCEIGLTDYTPIGDQRMTFYLFAYLERYVRKICSKYTDLF